MDAPKAIEHMVEKSLRTATEISRALGKNRNYVAVLEKQQSVPRMDTFCRLAHECGYRVIVESGTDETDSFELYSEEDAERFALDLLKAAKTGKPRLSADEISQRLQDSRSGYSTTSEAGFGWDVDDDIARSAKEAKNKREARDGHESSQESFREVRQISPESQDDIPPAWEKQ